MDGNGEMVNVFTNDARKGWDVLNRAVQDYEYI
jgi:hypothetical protein